MFLFIIKSFIRSFIRLFIHYPFIYLFIHSFIYSFIHSFILSLIQIFIRSSIHSLIDSSIILFIYLFSLVSTYKRYQQCKIQENSNQLLDRPIEEETRIELKGSYFFLYFSIWHLFTFKIWPLFSTNVRNKSLHKCRNMLWTLLEFQSFFILFLFLPL